jgi:hypothetical protein
MDFLDGRVVVFICTENCKNEGLLSSTLPKVLAFGAGSFLLCKWCTFTNSTAQRQTKRRSNLRIETVRKTRRVPHDRVGCSACLVVIHNRVRCRSAQFDLRDYFLALRRLFPASQFCAWLFSSQTIDFNPKGKTYENLEKFSVSVG